MIDGEEVEVSEEIESSREEENVDLPKPMTNISLSSVVGLRSHQP